MTTTPQNSNPRKDVTVRAIQERDVDQVVEMHRLIGSPVDAETVRNWCREDPYSRRLVAEVDGRAVGKVTLDTAYQPYSELVNLMVHPDYRRRGVANRLVQGCIREARSRRHPIILLMTEPENTPAINLYARNGFINCIQGGPGEREFTWMMRLPEDSVAGRFKREHPSCRFTPPRGRTLFHERPLYEMLWQDPGTDSLLGLLLEGQPGQPMRGGTAPRIAAATIKDGARSVDLLIQEERAIIEAGKDARFQLLTVNSGEEDITIEGIGYLHPKGVRVSEESKPPTTIKPGAEAITRFRASLDHDFDVPILSFATVLLILSVKIRGVEPPVLVTAGFERG
jgi:ribosomal-protein-alanine N-acetyltransferase